MRAKPPGRVTRPWIWLSAAALLLPLSLAKASSALTNYRLDCMGCHLADGSGAPGKVPDMRQTIGVFASTPAGRRYLVEIPGSAQAPLSDFELARLLNWMVSDLSARPAPRYFDRFTAAEVARYRRTPLIRVSTVRRRLLAAGAH